LIGQGSAAIGLTAPSGMVNQVANAIQWYEVQRYASRWEPEVWLFYGKLQTGGSQSVRRKTWVFVSLIIWSRRCSMYTPKLAGISV